MPCPPPETPVDATVAGRLAVGGGGNGWLAMWLAGAACTDPVTSAGAALRDAYGLALGLPNRDVSALQPAKPAATTPSTASRDQGRRLENMSTERIGLLTATQQARVAVNNRRVKIALSRKPALNTNRLRRNWLQFACFSGQKRHKSHRDQVLAREALFSLR